MDIKHFGKLFAVIAISCGVTGCRSGFQYPGSNAPPSVAVTEQNPFQTGPVAAKPYVPGQAISNTWNSLKQSAPGAQNGSIHDGTSLGGQEQLSAESYCAAGNLLETKGMAQEAEGQYQQALKLNPKHLKTLVSLARFYDRNNEAERAIKTYNVALKAHPHSALVHNDLGLCYSRMGKGDKALPLFTKAVELEPRKANYRHNLADALVQKGDFDKAYQHLAAVEAEPIARFNHAVLLSQRGQMDRAVAQLEKAIEIDATMHQAEELLAQLQSGGDEAVRVSQQSAPLPTPKSGNRYADPNAPIYGTPAASGMRNERGTSGQEINSFRLPVGETLIPNTNKRASAGRVGASMHLESNQLPEVIPASSIQRLPTQTDTSRYFARVRQDDDSLQPFVDAPHLEPTPE